MDYHGLMWHSSIYPRSRLPRGPILDAAIFPGYVKTPDALSLEGDVACDLSLTGRGTMGYHGIPWDTMGLWQKRESSHCQWPLGKIPTKYGPKYDLYGTNVAPF